LKIKKIISNLFKHTRGTKKKVDKIIILLTDVQCPLDIPLKIITPSLVVLGQKE